MVDVIDLPPTATQASFQFVLQEYFGISRGHIHHMQSGTYAFDKRLPSCLMPVSVICVCVCIFPFFMWYFRFALVNKWQLKKHQLANTFEATCTLQGLFAASAGCHPGGGVMGCAGHNAAVQLLKGLGLQPFWQRQ